MSYVVEAEKIIHKLYVVEKKEKITTTQIRGLLTGISDIYNDVVQLKTNELTEELKNKILYLKVQFVYAAGRETKVKTFIDRTEILKKIDNALKGKKEFMEMERYMESLVAYHRYYGGKDE